MKTSAQGWKEYRKDTHRLLSYSYPTLHILKMVEGHGVHRVATRHKQILLNRTFLATSPNGRFTDGAKSISGKKLTRIEVGLIYILNP